MPPCFPKNVNEIEIKIFNIAPVGVVLVVVNVGVDEQLVWCAVERTAVAAVAVVAAAAAVVAVAAAVVVAAVE